MPDWVQNYDAIWHVDFEYRQDLNHHSIPVSIMLASSSPVFVSNYGETNYEHYVEPPSIRAGAVSWWRMPLTPNFPVFSPLVGRSLATCSIFTSKPSSPLTG